MKDYTEGRNQSAKHDTYPQLARWHIGANDQDTRSKCTASRSECIFANTNTTTADLSRNSHLWHDTDIHIVHQQMRLYRT